MRRSDQIQSPSSLLVAEERASPEPAEWTWVALEEVLPELSLPAEREAAGPRKGVAGPREGAAGPREGQKVAKQPAGAPLVLGTTAEQEPLLEVPLAVVGGLPRLAKVKP